MAKIPLPLLSRHFISLTITGQNVTAGTSSVQGGVLSDASGASVNVIARKKGFTFDLNPIKEELGVDGSTVAHHVVLADDATANIDTQMVNDGFDPEPLIALFGSYDYFKIVWVLGTGASARTYVTYGSRGNFNNKSSGRGAIMGAFSFDAIDAGVAILAVS